LWTRIPQLVPGGVENRKYEGSRAGDQRIELGQTAFIRQFRTWRRIGNLSGDSAGKAKNQDQRQNLKLAEHALFS
jgi:hypothetical protein